MYYDNNFLKELMENSNRIVHCRITSLSLDEYPQETIQGKATTGSINVDGNSAIRRTCQLTLITQQTNFQEYLWTLSTKFKLEIGLENHIDETYPNIIWFNQGIYVITSFSQSLSNNTCTINISGKDKMCLLNGEVSGILPFEVDFGSYEDIDQNGNRKLIKYPIKDIIREAVHQYANEPFHNIIINNLDNIGLQLQEYRYNTPLYLIREAKDTTLEYINSSLDGNLKVYMVSLTEDGTIDTYSRPVATTIAQLPFYDALIDSFTESMVEPTYFTFSDLVDENSVYYAAAKIDYGETAGYTETELTYTGELIANVGETITSVLDKIKDMLGNYEYFYNVEGQFIFQEKQTYINNAWTPIMNIDGVLYVDPGREKYIYNFDNMDIFTAVNNTPNIANLKNDYAVWGTRKSATGDEIPIHMRYAIDNKPQMYITIQVDDAELEEYNRINNFTLRGQNSICYWTGNEGLPPSTFYDDITQTLYLYPDEEFNIEKKNEDGFSLKGTDINATNNLSLMISPDNIMDVRLCDWRELIYQMALDYRKYNHLDDFYARVAKANPQFFPTGITGYEQYYIDMEAFWRQLYNYEDIYSKVHNPMAADLISYYDKQDIYTQIQPEQIADIVNGTQVYYKDVKDAEQTLNLNQLTHSIDQWKHGSAFGDVNLITVHENSTQNYNYEFKFTNANNHTAWIAMCQDISHLQGQKIDVNFQITLPDNLESVLQIGSKLSYIEYGQCLQRHAENSAYPQIFYNSTRIDLNDISNNDILTYQTTLLPYNQKYEINGTSNYVDSTYFAIIIHVELSEEALPGTFTISNLNLTLPDANTIYRPIAFPYTVNGVQPELYTLTTKYVPYTNTNNYNNNRIYYQKSEEYYKNATNNMYNYWNKKVYEAPNELNFWFDFLETTGDLDQFSVRKIGQRPKAVNDKQVRSIYNLQTPLIIFTKEPLILTEEQKNKGYKYLQTGIHNFDKMFSISTQGKSAKNAIDELLYQYAYCVETISITSMPIYTLEPNALISVQDSEHNITGEYIINKLTIPLAYNGTMNINATKAINRLF